MRGTNQCCGSGMFIPDPGSWFLPIPDPGSRIQKQQQKTGVKKKFFVKPFFEATNFTKLNIILFVVCWRKKFGLIFQELLKFFTQKIVTKPSKIWVWDPGSEIRDPEKTYSGSRIQGSKRHRIPDPDPQHWKKSYFVAILMVTDEERIWSRIQVRIRICQ